ncbi:monofunctional biosynthetic peptidoglycan transglycosylase [Rhodopila sp.]|uniref:monofunctional biosynthetic peptidoglycan transglycosylase n=1 Tax=Rhodopila sp. TaxID=2480087 RepID=UPI002C53E06E|nr:monofunctional biosynthetic peptidoglycan transglycosylase [Rhodopila sp.]HVZ06958.1 monofunctional biosynthetic peptidoglycan transglycosylase [Rhodopila sp.]
MAVIAALTPTLLIVLFRFVPVPMTPLMVLRLAQGHGWHHRWVPLDRISPDLAKAVIASEDNWFCAEWFGFDVHALGDQIAALSEGEYARGASTITMQTAKNLFLLPGRDWLRKGIEALLTPQIAVLWPKQRVLEVYLNIVEFGPGIYGAEAAARAFFGRPAAGLTRQQAVQLAVVLPNPLEWSAAAPTSYLKERAAVIDRRIGQLGWLLSCAR